MGAELLAVALDALGVLEIVVVTTGTRLDARRWRHPATNAQLPQLLHALFAVHVEHRDARLLAGRDADSAIRALPPPLLDLRRIGGGFLVPPGDGGVLTGLVALQPVRAFAAARGGHCEDREHSPSALPVF